MNDNDMIMPVRHSTLSSVGSTAAGAVGGGYMSGLKGYLITTAVCAVAGGLLASGLLPAAGALWPIIGVAVGTLFGGLAAGPAVGTLTGIFGGARGGASAAHRVRQEKSAALLMDSQLAAYQAQQMAPQAQTSIYTAPVQQKYAEVAPQGSAQNPAFSAVNSNSVQYDGRVDGLALQRGA